MPLVLLDRDGVINEDSPRYVKSRDEWQPIPGSIDAIVALKRGGFAVAVCTNQSAIARGLMDEHALAAVHRRMCDALSARGAALDAIYYCPHGSNDGCDCRKPKPAMLLRAMSELGHTPSETTAVGDSMRDLHAARAARCGRSVLVRTGNGRSCEASAAHCRGVEVFDDLAAFAAALLARC